MHPYYGHISLFDVDVQGLVVYSNQLHDLFNSLTFARVASAGDQRNSEWDYSFPLASKIE